MCVTSEDSKHNVLLTVGLLFLTVAEIARFIVQRQHLSSGMTDGLTGLAFGVAIGTLLLGVYRKARPSCHRPLD